MFAKVLPNFAGLVLGRVEAENDFCNKICVRQHFSPRHENVSNIVLKNVHFPLKKMC